MKFIATFFISSFLLLGLFVGLIVSVDPYDKLGNNLFNFKTKAVAQSRENKYYMLESSKKDYKAFILGSSAAHRYPTQKVVELTGLTTYNYAVQHSTPIDYLAITRHIFSKFKPELILIQLDFAGFDEKYRVDNRLFNSPLNDFLKEIKAEKPLFDNNYFTLDALRDSLRVFYVNYLGEARHIYLEDGNYRKEKLTDKPVKIRQGNNIDYTFSLERLKTIKEIKELCKKNNTKLIVFSAPLSYGHIKNIRNFPRLTRMHQTFKKELGEMFDPFFDFQNESMKEFESFKYFHDSTHPTKEMSSIVLDRLLNPKNTKEIGLEL